MPAASLAKKLEDYNFNGNYVHYSLCSNRCCTYTANYSVDLSNTQVQKEINQFQTALDKRLGIATNHDHPLGRNAFHFLLNGARPIKFPPLYDWVVNSKTLREGNPLPYFYQRTPNFINFPTDEYAQHHQNLIKNKLITYYENLGATQPPDIDEMFKSLLAPFAPTEKENYDEELVQALICKDKKGDAPIHFAYQYTKTKYAEIYLALDSRIDTLSSQQKLQLATVTDKDNKNLFHHIGIYWTPSVTKSAITLYGASAALKALLDKSKSDENSYLHLACKSNHLNLEERILAICELWKQDVVPDSFNAKKYLVPAFDVNKAGQNPFHLIAANTVLPDTKIANPTILAMCELLDEATRFKKMTTLDHAGLNPIHYAVKTNNLGALRALLHFFKPQQQQELLKKPTKNKETSLQIACAYGDIALIQFIMATYDPADLAAEIHQSKSVLQKLARNNKSISLEVFNAALSNNNKLFNVYQYFIDKVKSKGKISDNIQLRLEQFQQAMEKRIADEFVEMPHQFEGANYYKVFTACDINHVTKDEALAFKAFLQNQYTKKIDQATQLVTSTLLTKKISAEPQLTKFSLFQSNNSIATPTVKPAIPLVLNATSAPVYPVLPQGGLQIVKPSAPPLAKTGPAFNYGR